MSGSAGSTAAQAVIDQGVGQIFTGRIGPKARPVLEGADITIFENQSGAVADIISRLQAAPQPNNPEINQDAAPDETRQASRNPAGYCFCPACGVEYTGDPDLPCFKQRCPQCNCGLERKYN